MTGSTSQQLHTGIVLDDRYELLEVIGSGGFGITYKARGLNLGKTVAIKEFFCREYMTRDEGHYPDTKVYLEGYRDRFESDRRKFLKEARIIRDFSEEPGIVHVLDYFEANKTAYIVMDYLEGETLKDLLAREKRLPAREIFKKMIPLIQTLGKLHKGGVIHRDISPDNIMVLADGSLCLIDFGAARNYAGSDTSYAMVLKDGYTPQEQYTGQEQGPWTDIYALSATLYQCITGLVPDNALQRILHDELRRPSDLSIKIDSRLEHILMKGLAPAGNKRYQTTDDMLEAIREVIPEDDGKRRLSKRARILLSTAALLTLALLIGGNWYVKNHQVELKFHGKETVYAILGRGSADPGSYRESLGLLKERLKVFTGDNYIMEKQDKDHTKIYFLKSLYQEKTLDYILKNYLTQPLELTVDVAKAVNPEEEDIDPSLIPDQPVILSPEDLARASLEKGKIQGLDREKVSLPETDDYYYIHVPLKKEKAEELKALYQKKDPYFQIYIDYPGPNIDFYLLVARCCEDGQSFDIIDHDQQKHMQQTLLHNLTSRRLPDAFILEDYSWPATWEDPEKSLTSGKYQKAKSSLKGETLTVKYTNSVSTGDDPATGQWFGDLMAFKARLDSLQIPYAFGLSKELSQSILVCLETDRLMGVMPDLVCCSSYLKISSSLGSNIQYETDSLHLTKGKDGQSVLACGINKYDENYEFLSQDGIVAYMTKYHDTDYYLKTPSGHYLAKGQVPGSLSGDNFLLDQMLVTDSGPGCPSIEELLYPLLKEIQQEPLSSIYELDDYRFYDEKGCLLDTKLSELPGYYDQSRDLAITKDARKAGFSSEIYGTSISLTYNCQSQDISADINEGLRKFEDFYQEHNLSFSPYENISFRCINKEQGISFFSFLISSNYVTGDTLPGRTLTIYLFVGDLKPDLINHVNNTPFYQAFTIKED